MEYIGQTGRQLKYRVKEHEADSKLDFRKKSGKKKKDQIDWNLITILAKENNYWKRISKEAYFITKHSDKSLLMNQKNECLTISSIWKTIL